MVKRVKKYEKEPKNGEQVKKPITRKLDFKKKLNRFFKFI